MFKKKKLSVIEIADRFVQEIKEKRIIATLEIAERAREVVANMKSDLKKKEMKELIRRSIVLWNEWKQKNQEEFRNVFTPEKGWHDIVVRGRKIDLSGVDFSNMDLDEKDTLLGGIDFRKVILKGTKFRKANLRNAAFCYADLRVADFTGADIEFASFAYADVWGTEFSETNSHRARFYGVNCGQVQYWGRFDRWGRERNSLEQLFKRPINEFREEEF